MRVSAIEVIMLSNLSLANSKRSLSTTTTRGRTAPLGAIVTPDGVNFSVFSRKATAVEILFFDREDDAQPTDVIRIDPVTNRTYHYWHVFVPGIRAGQLYGYRFHGPFDPAAGMRFDPEKVLLDPYGRGVAVPKTYNRDAARGHGDNAATAMKSVVVDPTAYDWEGDMPLRRPSTQTIVYEMHVKGFTRNPNSGVGDQARGACLPVRRPGLPAWCSQLLGLSTGVVLRSTSSI